MLAVAQKFSNVQQELLKLYRTDVPDEVLIEIKELLSRFFAERAMDGMDKLWDEQGWNNETMDEWLNSPKEVSHS
jgi:hypothetical protein